LNRKYQTAFELRLDDQNRGKVEAKLINMDIKAQMRNMINVRKKLDINIKKQTEEDETNPYILF